MTYQQATRVATDVFTRSRTARRSVIVGLLLLGLAAGRADADVCITIDEAHDTLTPQDRTSALLLATKQFELAGERVVPADCSTPYTLSHVRLGNTISVTLTGPSVRREGSALGLDDLPALYSQMIRSIVTGYALGGMKVVDRTNVTASQASPLRVQSDSFGYARLGYSGMFGDRTYGAPDLGFGYRVELDSFGIDVSFFNLQPNTSADSGYSGAYSAPSSFSGSFLKLEGLHFTNPHGATTGYLGGGVSWGARIYGGGMNASGKLNSAWHGTGLEGNLTVGYELARATTVRLFAQADAVLPFYKMSSDSESYRMPCARCAPIPVLASEHRYAPSIVISLGLGWQRDRNRH